MPEIKCDIEMFACMRVVEDSFAIDEMDPALLQNLKKVAKEWIDDMEKNDPARMNRLIKALAGEKYS